MNMYNEAVLEFPSSAQQQPSAAAVGQRMKPEALPDSRIKTPETGNFTNDIRSHNTGSPIGLVISVTSLDNTSSNSARLAREP